MRKIQLAIALLWLLAASAQAQQTSPDSLDNRLKALEKGLAAFKKLRITGYIQAQWQLAQAPGIKSYAAGDFADGVKNRFLIRRGRIKFTFGDPNFQLVYQPEITEKGISLRDAYGSVTEPWLGQFSLAGGVFNRPFSYENTFSSGNRETPERARFCQVMLPNERETGAMLSWRWKDLKIDGGLFNGNSIASDNDSHKDFIGRAAYSKTAGAKQYGIAVSYYRGGIRQGTNQVFEFWPRNNEHLSGMFLKDTLNGAQLGRQAKREYVGFDAQYSLDWAAGKTTLRVETITGSQPGLQKSNESPRTRDSQVGDIYIRSAWGGAVYAVQNLGKLPFQAVLKYDWFDPNTHVKGTEIGQAGSNLGAADLQYTTLGMGINLLWKNLTFMVYYDWVVNEKAPNLAGFGGDVKDNVLTIRSQVKF